MGERDEVMKYLKTLADGKLAELMQEVFAEMTEERVSPTGFFIRDSYAMVRASFSENREGESETFNEFVGVPTADAYEYGNAGAYKTITESGDCEECGCNFCSVAKRANCPVCGAEVGLT